MKPRPAPMPITIDAATRVHTESNTPSSTPTAADASSPPAHSRIPPVRWPHAPATGARTPIGIANSVKLTPTSQVAAPRSTRLTAHTASQAPTITNWLVTSTNVPATTRSRSRLSELVVRVPTAPSSVSSRPIINTVATATTART